MIDKHLNKILISVKFLYQYLCGKQYKQEAEKTNNMDKVQMELEKEIRKVENGY